MDAYLEEELFDLIIFCLQADESSPEYKAKKNRISEIGKEVYQDGGSDAMENMFFAIQNRIKEENGADAGPYRSLWNGISAGWTY